MEFKGTKGKWELDINDIQTNEYGSKLLTINHPIKGSVECIDVYYDARMDKKEAIIELKANALLISKAPEMLELLKETLYTLEIAELQSTENYKKIETLIKQATQL